MDESITSLGKPVKGSSEFKPSPPEKYIYTNMMNVGVSATDITIDFGRIVVEQREGGPVNVGYGQISVVMAKQTARLLRDTLDNVLKNDPTNIPEK
ncbi:DUF3467 domain-containing protein [Leptospirillum ferriphilum]|uniref:Uncharacterized protein n=1 Tax=Leptospirillum ferriphilum (strain ML-04) TaxID=1048260 RepID=J9Z8W1_LEPFM|nr:DUF3467 domain-containing protein [Leptospirillum ferriphilum]AFS52940.1 hypothetical protein LFML04_0705 [Leptospirillum ferriphilum ML-04]OOH80767.1 hypothetical protein BOX30_05355 [Leptospirillum ferriphilum]